MMWGLVLFFLRFYYISCTQIHFSQLGLNTIHTGEFSWALDCFLFHPFLPFSPFPLFLSQKRNWITKPTQFPFLHIWKFLWEFSDFCEPTIIVSGKLRAGFRAKLCLSSLFHSKISCFLLQ